MGLSESKVKKLVRKYNRTKIMKMYEKGEDVVPELLSLLYDTEREARNGAVFALGGIAVRDPSSLLPAIPRLIELLSDEDFGTLMIADVTFALWSLAKKHPKKVKPAIARLIALLNYENYEVQTWAATALATLSINYPEEMEPAIPRLMALLNYGNGDICGNAAFALGNIGAEKALESLDRLSSDNSEVWVDDKDTTVGQVAREAVEKIREFVKTRSEKKRIENEKSEIITMINEALKAEDTENKDGLV